MFVDHIYSFVPLHLLYLLIFVGLFSRQFPVLVYNLGNEIILYLRYVVISKFKIVLSKTNMNVFVLFCSSSVSALLSLKQSIDYGRNGGCRFPHCIDTNRLLCSVYRRSNCNHRYCSQLCLTMTTSLLTFDLPLH